MEGTEGGVISRLYFRARDMELQNALKAHHLTIASAALGEASYDSQRDPTMNSTKDSINDVRKDMQQETLESDSSSHHFDGEYINYDEFENLPSFIPCFSTERRSSMGFVIGRNALCNLALDHPSLAQFHGAFTFDSSYRLIFRDLGSRHGTLVKYKKEVDDNSKVRNYSGKTLYTGFGGLIRRDFAWIVGGPGVYQKVEVRLGETLLI